MPGKLFLLDGMALVYRAHFAFIQRPILTSKGINASALFGFTQTLLDLRATQQPTHLAVAFDTAAPTRRHREFPEYKAQREAMPEELSAALPHVRRMIEAFRIPVLIRDGYEADDIIGTLVQRAETEGLESYMVTPDKDFGQLVTPRTFLYRPGRLGGEAEILGPDEIRARWGIRDPAQVIDILGLMGDASDNIPGVPGIGEKTAMKLIAQFGTIESLLERVSEVTGKLKEKLETHRDQALLSKRLATIDRDVPIEVAWPELTPQPPDDTALRSILAEFEFNTLGRRLFGEGFKAGRGFAPAGIPSGASPKRSTTSQTETAPALESAPPKAHSEVALRRLEDIPHRYTIVRTAPEQEALFVRMRKAERIALAVGRAVPAGRDAAPDGVGLSIRSHESFWLPWPAQGAGRDALLDQLRSVLVDEAVEKIGFDLKTELGGLLGVGLEARGAMFDVMLAHGLVEPDLRHSLAYMSESLLGYTPLAEDAEGSAQGELGLDLAHPERGSELAMERADLALQLRDRIEPLLSAGGQDRVFRDVEMPLVPVLADMEREGIRIDTAALEDFSAQLSREMAALEGTVHRLAGVEFNVNSPKQLGEVLFERLRLMDSPKKTRTGQYATDEQTLLTLAGDHEIVRRLLEYRECSKLKSTYADALPGAVNPRTGRVHTTYHQLLAVTGRLSSNNPNLQNIPIRSGLGQEIRKAFVPRAAGWLLLSADYSQIELRIIAALSREAGLLEAFGSGRDVHTATAARVYGVLESDITPEMRKTAKMVNYGIAYGISAFGLAQRLGIPRKEAAAIIDHYFAQFPGIRNYMQSTIELCRQRGYAETVTGRRRLLRDIRSANAVVRGAAERNAINMPIQGTAADMIKIAMARIHGELNRRGLRTRMLLQVHDELLFDLFEPERETVEMLVEEKMRTALALDVPIVVEMGTGRNWLEAH